MPSSGYCRICDSPLKNEINRRLRRGESAPSIIGWAAIKDFKVSKPTILKHKAHVTDSKTTLVEKARRNPAIKKATTTEFLEALVDIGFTRATEDPESVSLDHALKASAQLEGRRDRNIDALMVIAMAFTKRLPEAEVVNLIEGEYREVPLLAESEAPGVRSESGPPDETGLRLGPVRQDEGGASGPA